MVAILRDGAEHQSLLWFDNPEDFEIDTTVKNTGNAAYHYPSGAQAVKQLPDTYTEIYLRFWVYLAAHGGQICISWYHDTTLQGRLYWFSDGTLGLQVATNNKVTGTTIIPIETWTMIELRAKIDNSAGVLTLWVNGVQDATWSGDTQPNNSYAGINKLYFGGLNGQRFDDIAVNDTSGSVNNGQCGDGRIYGLFPTSDGSETDWTGSYADVDEAPPDADGTTDLTTSTAGDRQTFNMGDLPVSDTILTVQVKAVAKKQLAEDSGIEIGLIDNSNETTVSTDPLTDYSMIEGDILAERPNSGGAWTKTAVDALQGVVEAE